MAKNYIIFAQKSTFSQKKIFFCADPVEDFNTIILSHHWGLYDLRCGWDPVLYDFAPNSICQPRYTGGMAKSEKSASSTHFRSFQYGANF